MKKLDRMKPVLPASGQSTWSAAEGGGGARGRVVAVLGRHGQDGQRDVGAVRVADHLHEEAQHPHEHALPPLLPHPRPIRGRSDEGGLLQLQAVAGGVAVEGLGRAVAHEPRRRLLRHVALAAHPLPAPAPPLPLNSSKSPASSMRSGRAAAGNRKILLRILMMFRCHSCIAVTWPAAAGHPPPLASWPWSPHQLRLRPLPRPRPRLPAHASATSASAARREACAPRGLCTAAAHVGATQDLRTSAASSRPPAPTPSSGGAA